MEEIEFSTEAMVTLEGTMEKVKEAASPGAFRTWLAGQLPGLFNFAFQVCMAAFTFFVGTRIIHWIRKMIRRGMDRAEVDLGVRQFMDSLVKWFLNGILIVLILTYFGVTAASVVAVIGSAGLALGLALQGSLENFAGGVLILLLKPFQVGDYIREDTHGNEGTVTEISLFYTKLATIDTKVVIIPNGTLANSSMTNVTDSDKRQIDLKIGIAYDADLRKAKEIIYDLALNERDRLKDESIQVFVSELSESEVVMGLRFWTKTEDYWPVRWRMVEAIKLALDDAGIEIPYRKLDVYVKSEK